MRGQEFGNGDHADAGVAVIVFKRVVTAGASGNNGMRACFSDLFKIVVDKFIRLKADPEERRSAADLLLRRDNADSVPP